MMRVVFFVFFIMAVNEKTKVHSVTNALTCPESPKELQLPVNGSHPSKNKYSFTYSCNSADEKFYFDGKIVCNNCYELDGMWLLVIISGDLLVTGGVMLYAYHQAQRKLKPPPATAANHQSASREPESNYEDLSPRTRDNAMYAGVHRTG